jgi:bla regulator protein blaR1
MERTAADAPTNIIAGIMTDRFARERDFWRKLLLSATGLLSVAAPVLFNLLETGPVHAQATSENAKRDIADTWQGTLHTGRDLRTVVKISKADGGEYKAVFYSIDQSDDGLPVNKITLDGAKLKISIVAIAGAYDGKLSSDGKSITGTWTQGSTVVPLTLTRATPETEWTIPPPTKLSPMDANAHPSFEVATIKPSKADQPGKFFRFRGRRFTTTNTTLDDLISYSYRIHANQIIGAPGWAETEKYDIDAEPDGEGMPNDQQWKDMMQKLLAERFALTFHPDKQELAVYVLSVARSGPKLNKSAFDPQGHFGWSFRGRIGGDLSFTNANMADFANLMQRNVLDRPVVDQTGLTGRYDFNLDFTPDDSQFEGMGAKVSPPTDSANPPPNLYTAIQEQLGLKLEATKALAEVLVIDHVEKPSEN